MDAENEEEKFVKIIPGEYALKLKEEFTNHPEKWYGVIIPKSVADELIVKTNDDYSQIWHEHCMECWISIDKNTEECYVSEDGFTWLCSDCFKKRNKKG